LEERAERVHTKRGFLLIRNGVIGRKNSRSAVERKESEGVRKEGSACGGGIPMAIVTACLPVARQLMGDKHRRVINLCQTAIASLIESMNFKC
jgi:hypothetical protein